MEKTLERAFVSARALHPNGEWDRLTPGERTKAIYREMRRLDAEQSAPPQPSGGDRGGLLEESAPAVTASDLLAGAAAAS